MAVELLDYDIEGKTITAVFEPSKVETEALEVVDRVVKIPIYSSMVQKGVNYIQLNFRWDTTKLEQSGKMLWVIDRSLETTGAAQEDVDIITYLISELKAIETVEADRIIAEAERERKEGIREQGEVARDLAYTEAETDRNVLYTAAENTRNQNSNGAISIFNTDSQGAISTFNTNGQNAINDFISETDTIEAQYPTRLTTVENDLIQHKLEYVELEREVTELSYITQRYTIESWQKVQELVRAGLADKAFKVGDQFVANYNNIPTVFDVIAINRDIPYQQKLY